MCLLIPLLWLLYAEYITAAYRILSVDATVTFEWSISPKVDVLEISRYALATVAVVKLVGAKCGGQPT